MDIKARKSKLSRYNSYVVILRKAFRILSLTAKFSVRRYATLRNGSRLNFIISTTEKITAHIWKWATMWRNKKCCDVIYMKKNVSVFIHFTSISRHSVDLLRFIYTSFENYVITQFRNLFSITFICLHELRRLRWNNSKLSILYWN